MQHTKVSEVQCFFFVCFFEISCNRKISTPWTEKVPTELQTVLGFSVDTLPAQDKDTAGHTFPPSGTRHMAGHRTRMKEMPWAATRAGHPEEKSLNTDNWLFEFHSYTWL